MGTVLPFEGFLEVLRQRIVQRRHAVILVAEGAGQQLLAANSSETDASGNRRLGDIGLFLHDEIKRFFRSLDLPITLKYIDPSYAIRSVPAGPQDNVYCSILAQSAVHAAMAGKTNMLVGRWHHTFVHIPFALVIERRRKIDPEGDIWRSVVETTGQPTRMSKALKRHPRVKLDRVGPAQVSAMVGDGRDPGTAEVQVDRPELL